MVTIETIGTYEDEIEGKFQEKLDKLEIYSKLTPPGTPQYNGVAEKVLRLLKEKSVVMLETMEGAYSSKLWAESKRVARGLSNISATTVNEVGVSPFEKCYEAPCSLDGIESFGTAS